MARIPKLVITPFANATGSMSWRVSGTIRGTRIRQNKATEAEAIAFRASLLEGLISTREERPVLTRLPEAVVRQAEAAVADLPEGTTLGQAVRFFRDNFRQLAPASIHDAAGTWAAWLMRARKNQEHTAAGLRENIRRFAKSARIISTVEITAEVAKGWIYAAPGVRTQRDRFDHLGRFCAWAVKERMMPRNPVVEDLDRPVVKNEKPPGIVSFEEARELLQCALTDPEGPDMLPYFAACVLTGGRPDEVPRHSWDDIQLEEEHPYLELNYAKGGRARRHIELCDAAVGIFRWCKARGLALGFFSKRKFNRIRRAAGLFDRWEKDLLRHTYASWHYALHHDVHALAATMGNSEDVLFQDYIRPMKKAEAAAFPGLCLNYQAPARTSAVGVRIDHWMRVPVDRVTAERLPYLRTYLAGEIARLERKAARRTAGERAAILRERDGWAKKLAEVMAALGKA